MKRYVHRVYFTAWGLIEDGKGGLREMTQEELHGDASMASRTAKILAESMEVMQKPEPAGRPARKPRRAVGRS